MPIRSPPSREPIVGTVDLDRYLAHNGPTWERLEELTSGGRRKTSSLSGTEIIELVRLYQQTSTHLSYVQTYYQDPALTAHLTKLVNNARAVIYGTKAKGWKAIIDFVAVGFPVAVFRARRFLAASVVLTMLPALAVGLWLANSNKASEAAIPAAAREAYLSNDFEAYYESERASQFSAEVYTNNVQVAVTAFAGGMLLGVPTVQALVFNGANVGLAAGIFTHYGEATKFWGLITPHGLLELTCVMLAGAAGLQLAWAVIDPGDRPRRVAIAAAGRSTTAIVLGTAVALGAAGFIEGFVTGQPWPTFLRVGIGVAVETAFVLYLLTQGIRHGRAESKPRTTLSAGY